MKKLLALLAAAALMLGLAACGTETPSGTDETAVKVLAGLKTVTVDSRDSNTAWESESYKTIDLSTDTEYRSGSDILISKAGVYRLTGTLNGSVKVTASGNVWLILDGVSISSTDYSPIYIDSENKTVITLASASSNILKDGGSYTQDADGDPSAVIFSKNDLTLNGDGALSITSLTANGIQSKDVLKIMGGSYDITAEGDCIKGRDALVITGGSFTLTAGKDGLCSNNDNNTGWGFIEISGGDFKITAADDGIQAVSAVSLSGGTLSVTAGGGAPATTASSGDMGGWGGKGGTTAATDTEETKSKGICCDGAIIITAGALTINSADDALNSAISLSISGGTLSIRSGDDGIHADSTVDVSGGKINIEQSYEGVESNSISVTGGDLSVTSSDDGFNASDGTTSTAGFGGQGGETGSSTLSISGGSIYVNANGDGLDANGSVLISGGTTFVDGPVSSANGALDSYNGITVTGGTLVAVGASGMAETLSGSSTQCGVLLGCSGQAGSELKLTDSAGNTIISYTPKKSYQCAVISSPDIKTGEQYTLYVGGTAAVTYTQSSVSQNAGSTGGHGSTGGRGDMGGGMTKPGSGTTAPSGGATPPSGGTTPPDTSSGATSKGSNS